MVIVWLRLQTLIPLSYFLLERAIFYTAVSVAGIIPGGWKAMGDALLGREQNIHISAGES